MNEHNLNILLTNATDIYGGGEYFVSEVARLLRDRGHNTWVACKPGNLLIKKCQDNGIPVYPLDFPARGELRKYIGLLKDFALKNAIDVIHTNSNYDRTAGAFAARLAGAKHVTNVHSFHSIQHNPTQWIRNRFATDHFLVDGFSVKELLERQDGIAGRMITVVHLGVDPDIMRTDKTLRASFRAEFGVADDEILIGNVGRLVPMKGQEYLLDAFAGIASSYPRSKLLLVGDGELMETLKEKSKGIPNRIIFAGFRDDLKSAYSAFDIYAHPSVEGGGETFPFAVLQALSQELPAVVTRVGDVAHMVSEGVNGFVVPDRNPDALGERLRALLQDEDLRQSMSRKSRELLLNRFTSGKMLETILGVYASAVRPA
ncbi:MAG TPA: glycosyltransferase family 4 protein [Bacteroidota bacterium]|jgi:glycosyltransferase involved in cell wall biosynthesis|nr:glycosyltransferase family 4 protein [Bacteroidota bacterium]